MVILTALYLISSGDGRPIAIAIAPLVGLVLGIMISVQDEQDGRTVDAIASKLEAEHPPEQREAYLRKSIRPGATNEELVKAWQLSRRWNIHIPELEEVRKRMKG